MRTRRLVAVGLLAGLTLGSLAAPAVAEDEHRADVTIDVTAQREYPYPYHDPYLATITIAALNATGVTPGLHRQVVHVPVRPGRNDIPTLEGRGVVSIALYRQDRPAPTVRARALRRPGRPEPTGRPPRRRRGVRAWRSARPAGRKRRRRTS